MRNAGEADRTGWAEALARRQRATVSVAVAMLLGAPLSCRTVVETHCPAPEKETSGAAGQGSRGSGSGGRLGAGGGTGLGDGSGTSDESQDSREGSGPAEENPSAEDPSAEDPSAEDNASRGGSGTGSGGLQEAEADSESGGSMGGSVATPASAGFPSSQGAGGAGAGALASAGFPPSQGAGGAGAGALASAGFPPSQGAGGAGAGVSGGATGATGGTTTVVPIAPIQNGYYNATNIHGYASTVGQFTNSLVPSCESDTDECFQTAGDELCMSGEVAPNDEYRGFALLTINVSQSAEVNSPKELVVPTGPIRVKLTGEGYQRVQIQTAVSVASDEFDETVGRWWCADVPAGGEGTIDLSRFNTKCWDDSGEYYGGQAIESIGIHVPGDDDDPVYFNFCIVELGW